METGCSIRELLWGTTLAFVPLKHLACGGQRKGLPPPSLNSFPSRSGPLLLGCGGQKERGEQRLPLGPSGGERQGPWQRGCPSVICDTLGSQLLLHPGQVGGVRVPKPGSKEMRVRVSCLALLILPPCSTSFWVLHCGPSLPPLR